MLIGVAGMVGCGKSTLARALADRYALKMATESVDELTNPWLDRFYVDMKRYCLNLQLHFLAERFESLRRMQEEGGDWVNDRVIDEDALVFAKGHYESGTLSPLEYQLYERLYRELLHSPAAAPPDLLVYLHGPLDTVLARIHERGRPKEKETAREYWEQLHDRYGRWIAGYNRSPVLALDIREYDLKADPDVIEDIAARIRERLHGRTAAVAAWPGASRAARAAATDRQRQAR